MNLKCFVSRRSINTLSRLNGRPNFRFFRNLSSNAPSLSQSVPPACSPDLSVLKNPINPKPLFFFNRCIHFGRENRSSQSNVDPKPDTDDSVEEEGEEDGTMNEFLSRFVWTMRPKIMEAYPDSDNKMIDGMLQIIVQKVVEEMEKGGIEEMLGSVSATPSQDFSEDLWRTVWEVSETVLKDMENEKKKEKMKTFLQSEEVKEMCRFAGEIGIRGDLLRELRFKWAKEKMEETEFYDSLESLREESEVGEKTGSDKIFGDEEESAASKIKPRVVSLPKRKGKMKFKIYGLDLSDEKWREVSDRIHDAGRVVWPHEPKPVTGKCKSVMEKLLSLKEEDDPSSLVAEWAELLQPSRVDWVALLDRLKEQNSGLYLKVAELILNEKSFEADIRDYSKLIDTHANMDHIGDAERLLKKMDGNGFALDILTASVLVHMYSKSGNIERAAEAFESLRSSGFQPDLKVYNSMITAYVNAGKPKLGESLMREMEARDITPTKEVYMALLRSFAQLGDVSGASRIAITMQFAGIQPSLGSCTLLVEAYGRAGDSDQARSNFDYMIKLGHKPDDRCISSMITAYEKNNLLDKALNLLLQLEKDGIEIGAATYTVMVDWMGKLGLVDEAEHLLGKISELGEVPPVKIHVSLCDMYSRAKNEKRTLQTLQVLESKKDQLAPQDFETVITGLVAGGFVQDARRVRGLMEARGFDASEKVKVALTVSQTFTSRKNAMR